MEVCSCFVREDNLRPVSRLSQNFLFKLPSSCFWKKKNGGLLRSEITWCFLKNVNFFLSFLQCVKKLIKPIYTEPWWLSWLEHHNQTFKTNAKGQGFKSGHLYIAFLLKIDSQCTCTEIVSSFVHAYNLALLEKFDAVNIQCGYIRTCLRVRIIVSKPVCIHRMYPPVLMRRPSLKDIQSILMQ